MVKTEFLCRGTARHRQPRLRKRQHFVFFHEIDAVTFLIAAWAFSVAGPMAWNSLPDLIRGIQRAAQTVLGVYLKRTCTCSRVTSASSALGVLNDYAIMRCTNPRTHSLTHYLFIGRIEMMTTRRGVACVCE